MKVVIKIEVDSNSASFEIDKEIVDHEYASSFLEFHSYDSDVEDVIAEMCKKVAGACWREQDYRYLGVEGTINAVQDLEGYPWLDGSRGITLTECDCDLIDEYNMVVTESVL